MPGSLRSRLLGSLRPTAPPIHLALTRVAPSRQARNCLQILQQQVRPAWFIRALHGWRSHFLLDILLVLIVQVFLFGAYKFPRELTWILGVFLLMMTLGMAFT